MIDKFESLPEEKQLNILNAAYKVFSTYGYTKASTNEIVKLAGISKGLLFHYFNTKQNLYFYLYKNAIDTIKTMVYDHLDLTNVDYLQRMFDIGFYKLQLSQVYPEMFKFVSTAYIEQIPELEAEIKSLNETLMDEGYAKILENIDFSMFREDLDLDITIKAINAILQDFSEGINRAQYAAKATYFDVETIRPQMEVQIEFMKKCFYKTRRGGNV